MSERAPHLLAATWEDLCRHALPLLGDRLCGIAFGPARRFWLGQGPEWDVVAAADTKNAILLGEAKWLAAEPTTTELSAIVHGLMAKGIPPAVGTNAEVHHAVFVPTLPRGAKRTVGNIHLVDAAAVLEVLRLPADADSHAEPNSDSGSSLNVARHHEVGDQRAGA
jgi:hypothetical protein